MSCDYSSWHQGLHFHQPAIIPARKNYGRTSLEFPNNICGAFLRSDSENALPWSRTAFDTSNLVELRFHRPWRGFRDGNSCAGKLSAQRLGKCSHEVLRRSVNSCIGHGRISSSRPYIQNCAMASADHRRQKMMREAEHGNNVDFEDLADSAPG